MVSDDHNHIHENNAFGSLKDINKKNSLNSKCEIVLENFKKTNPQSYQKLLFSIEKYWMIEKWNLWKICVQDFKSYK